MKLNNEYEKFRLAALDRLKASVEQGLRDATNHVLPELRTCPVVGQLRELFRLQLIAIEHSEGMDIADVSQGWIDFEHERFIAVEKAIHIISIWQFEYNKTQSAKTNKTGLRRKPIPKRRRR